MSPVHVRRIKDHTEFRQCEELQRMVWGGLSVSSEVMNVAQKYGGAVLGAFVDGALAGFLYAFLARRKGRTIHWSHMMAVSPDFRDRGLGFRMKLAHRKFALEQGIKSICWTFDPLQSRNATLNIARLGAQPEEYIADCYGHFRSKIEIGLPSDRFVVNWRIDSARVRGHIRRIAPEIGPALAAPVNETEVRAGGLRRNRRLHFDLRNSNLLVEIPANTDEIRSQDATLALNWRLETRKIFQKYLAAGYRVETFLPPASSAENRCFYCLRRVR